MTTGVGVLGKGKSVVASVGGGLSIAVGPWQVIAADRRLAADALGGDPPTELLLLPSPQWVLEDVTLNTPRAALEEVVAEIAARGIDIHCDYHHQSLYAAKTGIQAPAAGWAGFSSFRVDAKGLWATAIRWTSTADSYLRNGEYRYFSPVVYFADKTLTVTSLDSWALTNTPRTNDQPPLTAALAAARFHSRRVAASMEAGMEKWISILINFLDSLWCYSPAELLEHIDTARQKFVDVMTTDADDTAAAASSDFAKRLPKDATILQALIAGGLKMPDGVTQLAAAAGLPADVLGVLDLPATTTPIEFKAHLMSVIADRVPRSEVTALQAELATLREAGEVATVDKTLLRFADRYTEAELPQLRIFASKDLGALELMLSKRAPVVRASASRETAPPAPKLALASRTVQVAGESRPATEDGMAAHEATMQILAEKQWPMSRYSEANDIRKTNEAASANSANA
jgi:phage I-like protein